MTSTIGVGVIGLGFMGWRHVDAYLSAAGSHPCKLRAVCDASPERWHAGLASPAAAARQNFREGVELYADPAQLLSDPRVQLVSICTYTESHVDLAIAALNAGKHVLVEKPVALSADAIRPLAEAASRSPTLCMPAMCMRFWPGWDWLHARITEHAFGRVRSARFERLGSPPAWAQHFYADQSRSGGALIDLHIHDADFLYWCFGRPVSVTTHGTLAHATTTYRYSGAPAHAAAEGGWSLHPSAGFRMRYTVAFEHATADFDIARTAALLLHTDAGSQPIDLPPGTGYDYEVRAMLQAIVTGATSPPCTMDDALAVAEMLDAERQSLETGLPVSL